MAQAEALALVLALLALNPELQEVLKIAILFAWAYLESVLDVRALMKGQRVPLMKTADTWKTSVQGILSPSSQQAEDNGKGGFSYDDYLRVLLYLESAGTKNLRLMDVMEMDIRKTSGNAGFRMDACIDAFHVQTAVTGAQGYAYETQQEFGYN